MTPEQWKTLQDLFEEVIQEPIDQRPRVLNRLESAISDPAMRLELRRLVEHAEVGSEFLRPVAGLGAYQDRPALQAGDVIAGRFEILQSIGKGGMAEVYEALDRESGSRVAIKIISPEFSRDPSLLERFRQEGQIARRIVHENICRIYDLGEHHGLPFLSMELLAGETLAKRLERGPLPLGEWSELARQLFEGLRAAHEAGVIHRDLKPSNLMLTGSRLVIFDFGLARPIIPGKDAGLTRTGTLIGTLDWMAPEQLLGKFDERSDLYSAALILLRAAKESLDANGSEGLIGALRRATTDSEFRAQIPKILPGPWRFVLLSCLERDPARRPRSVEEVQKLVRAQHIFLFRIKHVTADHWKAFGVALVVLALFALSIRTLWYSSQQKPRGLKPGSMIMIAFTDNKTGDNGFDGLTTVVRAEFGQSSRFNLWDQARLDTVASQMRHDPNARLSEAEWREMALRENVPLLVFSTLARSGNDGYSFSMRCEQIGATPESPVQSWQETETASGPTELFAAVHKVATRVRTRAGENATELSANNRLPQDITSSSWEALELYGEAQSLYSGNRADEAVAYLRRAVQLDPNFAMGLMRLGDILDSQNKFEEGLGYWEKAVDLAAAKHLSEHERLSIEGRYAIEIKDFNRAEPVLRAWTRAFPNDPVPAQLLAWCLLQMAHYDEGVRVAQESQNRFPPTMFGTSVLIRALAAENKLADAEKLLSVLDDLSQEAVAQGFRGIIAALRGDYDTAAGFFQDVIRSNDVRESSRAVAQLANLEADRGNLDAAQKLLRDGISKDRQTGDEGLTSQKTVTLAFLEGIQGNHTGAIALARDAASMRRYPWVVVQAVSILARYGKPADATRLMASFPAGKGPKYDSDLLRMKGEILAAKGNFKQALDDLEKAANLDRPLQPKEYVARVLDLAGDRERARNMYQRIVDTSFLTWISDEEWPGTRFRARQYLKKSKGE